MLTFFFRNRVKNLIKKPSALAEEKLDDIGPRPEHSPGRRAAQGAVVSCFKFTLFSTNFNAWMNPFHRGPRAAWVITESICTNGSDLRFWEQRLWRVSTFSDITPYSPLKETFNGLHKLIHQKIQLFISNILSNLEGIFLMWLCCRLVRYTNNSNIRCLSVQV